MTPADRLAFEAHERAVSSGVALHRYGQSNDSLGAYQDPLVEQRWQGWQAALSAYRNRPPVDIEACARAINDFRFTTPWKEQSETVQEWCREAARAVLREAGVIVDIERCARTMADAWVAWKDAAGVRQPEVQIELWKVFEKAANEYRDVIRQVK